ncbi:MAG: ribulose-phosphate 3-epimerase [Candidatus Omnitrophica bacterium]|nr:ribulose-phosphate 3-epimerase [Candidatus Omnitrophota bacterium]
MTNKISLKVAPSILACDFGRLKDEIHAVEQAGADMLHIDVMDGHFVDNITIGPQVVAAVRKYTSMAFDVHLMIEHPKKYLQPFIDAGSNIITVHQEAEKNLDSILATLDASGVKKGVSLRPATHLDELGGRENDFDMILLMTVNPGFGGQSFMAEVLPKIQKLRSYYTGDIEVDGGINAETAHAVIGAGATVLVAGTYIFRSPDYKKAIASLKRS